MDQPQTMTHVRKTWVERILAQGGAWDQVRTPEMLRGAPALPMPVKIAEPETLAPYFEHLRNNGNHVPKDLSIGKADVEPYYSVPLVEFEKGVVYADRRLDLCKMVVGPLNIGPLMDSLDTNTFVEHFLLGNNIIGPAGARRIAKFVQDHPNRMDTWYLAGNCIDAASLKVLVDSLVSSTATNLWLKRNPLGPDAVPDLARYILRSKHLRVLDLDQTELGDEGVVRLFDTLLEEQSPDQISLKHLYLNASGIGLQAAERINRFLRSSKCNLESLYLSNNPIGDDGATALSQDITQNKSLQRLVLSSIGLTSTGAKKLLESFKGHAALTTLNIGQSYATEDLGSKFNHVEDSAVDVARDFMLQTPNLRYFVLSHTAISYPGLNKLLDAVLETSSICYFFVQSIPPATGNNDVVKARIAEKKLRKQAQEHLRKNVAAHYDGMDYQTFNDEQIRWLTGPVDELRKIDSVYRNRDARAQRLGLKVLDKHWTDDDQTLVEVMAS